jgi:putative intracellular protease/amidase
VLCISEEAQAQFNNPVSIAQIESIDEFAAVYVPGGHGIVEDGPTSKKLASLLQQFYEAGKVVSSVCHGPASFTGTVKADGEPLVKGKKVGLHTPIQESWLGAMV